MVQLGVEENTLVGVRRGVGVVRFPSLAQSQRLQE